MAEKGYKVVTIVTREDSYLSLAAGLIFELFEFWTLCSGYTFWTGGEILFELIVSDNLKLNERNYFEFSFCHLCEGIMCSQWDTRYNVVTAVKSEGPNLHLAAGYPRLFWWYCLFMCVKKYFYFYKCKIALITIKFLLFQAISCHMAWPGWDFQCDFAPVAFVMVSLHVCIKCF